MGNYWIGKRTVEDEQVLVFDPEVQIAFPQHVYLFIALQKKIWALAYNAAYASGV